MRRNENTVMTPAPRYLLTFPGTTGTHAPQRQVIVTATHTRGPGGHEIYTDETGRLRVEINEHGCARLLTSGPGANGLLHAAALA
ncbi:DUF6296 family protein [Kitasatospora sp. NPDC058397]|uniref:DUF6296 family protein n=2 Tax=Kitasatospora TaxID=2063 RepID=UPI003647C9F9